MKSAYQNSGSLKERIAQIIEGDTEALLGKYGEALQQHRTYRANLEVLKKDEKVVLAKVRSKAKAADPKATVASVDDIAYCSPEYAEWRDEYSAAALDEATWGAMATYMAEALTFQTMLISFAKAEMTQLG